MRFRLGLRYAWGIAHLRASDVLTASFPRSGSTRLRILLAELATPESARLSDHRQLDRIAPELGGPTEWDRLRGPLFIKTHRPRSTWLARPRAILLLRHPLDALASFHAYRSALRGVASLSPAAFLRDSRVGLPRWIAHTRSWRPHVEAILRYPDMREDPVDALGTMLDTLDIPYAVDALARAVELATPDAAQRLVQTRTAGDRYAPNFVFARTSRDQPRTSFSADDQQWASRQLEAAGLTDLVATLR